MPSICRKNHSLTNFEETSQPCIHSDGSLAFDYGTDCVPCLLRLKYFVNYGFSSNCLVRFCCQLTVLLAGPWALDDLVLGAFLLSAEPPHSSCPKRCRRQMVIHFSMWSILHFCDASLWVCQVEFLIIFPNLFVHCSLMDMFLLYHICVPRSS